MMKGVFGKVVWVGRATVFMVGLSVIVALSFGMASTAAAHTGGYSGLLHLGHSNAVTKLSTLVGTLASPILKVDNNGTGAALSLEASSGKPPLVVNATAGKATNLNADKIDGKDSTQFANSTHTHAGEEIASGTVGEGRLDGAIARDGEVVPTVLANDGAGSNLDADKIDGKDSSGFYAVGSKVADADRLDGLDSNAFGVATADNAVQSSECDFISSHNQCAPIQVVVPPGKTYIVSIWSIGTWKGGGIFDSQVHFCSSYRPNWASAGNCEGATGFANVFNTLTLQPGKFASGTAEGEVTLTADTYIIYTRVENTSPTQEDIDANVITKVLVRDASVPRPTGISIP